MLRTLRIYPFNNFYIWHTAGLLIFVTLYIASIVLILSCSWKFLPFVTHALSLECVQTEECLQQDPPKGRESILGSHRARVIWWKWMQLTLRFAGICVIICRVLESWNYLSGRWSVCILNLNTEKLQRERDEGPPASVFSPKACDYPRGGGTSWGQVMNTEGSLARTLRPPIPLLHLVKCFSKKQYQTHIMEQLLFGSKYMFELYTLYPMRLFWSFSFLTF